MMGPGPFSMKILESSELVPIVFMGIVSVVGLFGLIAFILFVFEKVEASRNTHSIRILSTESSPLSFEEVILSVRDLYTGKVTTLFVKEPLSRQLHVAKDYKVEVQDIYIVRIEKESE